MDFANGWQNIPGCCRYCRVRARNIRFAVFLGNAQFSLHEGMWAAFTARLGYGDSGAEELVDERLRRSSATCWIRERISALSGAKRRNKEVFSGAHLESVDTGRAK